FGPTTAYDSSTAAETLGVSVVPTPFDAVASGLAEGSTIHYRAVAAPDCAPGAGPAATVRIGNEPPVVSIGHLGLVIHRGDLGRPPTLSLPLEVNEPATVTIQILKGGNVVQEAP